MNKNLENGIWLNEPAVWKASPSTLTMTTDKKTDFWRKTHYGFNRDSGHMLGIPATGDFTARVRVQGEFRSLYDQAGLMLRIDADRWIKTGVEFTDGERFLSTVVTNGASDWSVSQPFDNLEDFTIRITLREGAARIQASSDGRTWPLLRLAAFPSGEKYMVGPMACTPERAGLKVQFSEFSLGDAITTDLHDLSA